MPRKRRIGSISDELLHKSREATLSAVQIFNNPLIRFKSEAYIVLMTIAWTYLLHAYYRKNGIEYRYFTQGPIRRVFDKTKSGSYKYWELERCLNDPACPIDRITCKNLKFLIGIRHEIEHQMTMKLDDYLGGRYQACAMNYNRYVKQLFGEHLGIDRHLTYSLQFLELSYEQLSQEAASGLIPKNLQTFILRFDSELTEDEFNNESYSYRLFFSKKLANRPGQADRVVEFIDPKSDLAKSIDTEYWLIRDREKPKLLPSEIVKRMQEAGFRNFTMHSHTALWKELDAKNPAKGYGVKVAKSWYWYELWLRKVEEYCAQNRERYA